MFNTVSVSEFQKAPARILKNIKGYSYILSNNKKVWLIISKEMTFALEESWILDKFEDIILSNKSKFSEEKNEALDIIKNSNYKECINFDELCELI